MNHQQRVDVYKQYMAACGADPNNAVPYLWQLAWARGWEIPPPPFMSVLALVLFAAVAFPALVLFIWLITMFRPHSHMPLHVAVWLAAAAGAVGVIATPVYFHRMARRYGLVKWSTFRGVRQRT